MIEELKIAELLCTRLCHDLTGPIGAVNNGAEFLSEEGFNMQGQAVELIVSSAFSAVTRLQFYRMAYGRVKDHGEANLSEKQKLALDFFTGSKITLDWPDEFTDSAGVSISLRMARLIYNLLIVASSALIRGGAIAVRIGQDSQGNKQVIISATGAGLKWDEEMDKIFKGQLSLAELSARNVQTYLTKRYVDDLSATLSCRVGEEELILQLTQPAG
jgi:histidine phosphotransferase ChpT